MSEQETRQSDPWSLAGETVQGATHIRNGLPNQDAIAWEPTEGSALPMLLAVSDGHGGKRYIRSATGSRLAVEAALSGLRRFYEEQAENGNPSAVKRQAEEQIPLLLTGLWRQRVEADIALHPFTAEEVASLEAHGYVEVQEELRADPYRAYGATLLGVLLAHGWFLCVQLGDGDILTVDPMGRTIRPMPPGEELLGEETHSLCEPNAERFCQIRIVPLEERDPVLILVSTDGLNKSYSHDDGFLKVGRDLLQMVRAEGMQAVKEQLPELLNEISRAGSGDDISLGLLKRRELQENDTPGEET